MPLLSGVLATVECRVAEVVGGGTHRVFLAEAVHAEATEGSPLAYFRGKFGKFELGQDAEVYRTAAPAGPQPASSGPTNRWRSSRSPRSLSASPSSVYYALTRLVGEKLVSRDPQRGHVVTPLDVATSDDAHDAKLAIELGAAELVVDRLTAEQLAELRELAAAAGRARAATAGSATSTATSTPTTPSTVSSSTRPASGPSSRPTSSSALPDLMARALLGRDGRRPAPRSRDHIDLVDALERADLPAVRRVMAAHNEHAKATQRAGILRIGGRL